MSDVGKLVRDSVEEVNKENLEACEREVKTLVRGIISKQSQIKKLSQEIIDDKKRLKELSVPDAVVLEL